MVAALNHRGPDDRGISDFKSTVCNPQSAILHICLGNTRLAIIDLSTAGHQPMHDEESGLSIIYNGETYNFEDLRRELGTEFGPWHSQTDTEVVLRAYRRWGVEAFARLRGMFALAIWDQQKCELILARDPFGIKPLYYAQTANPESPGFIFASEVRALLASGSIPRKLSDEGVASYLRVGSIEAPLTIVDGVRSVMPGNFIRISHANGGLHAEEQTYLPQTVSATPKSRQDAIAALREKLRASVKAHLVSDVPVGVFLSGGMDSSALVALMSQVSSEPPRTFSVVFDEQKFSEAPHARFVADRFKTDHQEVHLTEERMLELLPEAIAALDQPTMDGINSYVVSKAVKDAGITVALSGLGGDELFAGYVTFRRALRMQSVSRLAKRFMRSAAGIGNPTNGSVRHRKFWQLAASDGSPEAVYAITRQLFSSDEVGRIVDCELRNANFKSAIRNPQSAIPKDPINAISILELQGYMANTLLRDTDCMSMAHSLEVRVPFVDREVVNYVLDLPGAWKMNGRPKSLLADVVQDLFPSDFFQRPKMGFTLPFENWMRSSLRDEISAVFDNTRVLSLAGLKKEEVDSVWSRFLQAPTSVGWSRPWALFVLIRWCESNGIVA